MKDEYLLDASALLKLISFLEVEKVRKIKLYITEFTPLEVGNALWKLYIKGYVSMDIAIKIIKLLRELILSDILKTLKINEYEEIMLLSLRRKITYYDASYIFLAKEKEMILVTEDRGMLENARIEGVNSITSNDFANRIGIDVM